MTPNFRVHLVPKATYLSVAVGLRTKLANIRVDDHQRPLSIDPKIVGSPTIRPYQVPSIFNPQISGRCFDRVLV